MSDGRERRNARRIPTSLQVSFNSVGAPGQSFQEIVSNISAGGVFIRTDQPLELGSELEMSISLGEDLGDPIDLRGEVVRVEEGTNAGMALRFLDADPMVLLRLLSAVVGPMM